MLPLFQKKFYFTVTDKNLANRFDTIQGQIVIVQDQQKTGLYSGKAIRFI